MIIPLLYNVVPNTENFIRPNDLGIFIPRPNFAPQVRVSRTIGLDLPLPLIAEDISIKNLNIKKLEDYKMNTKE